MERRNGSQSTTFSASTGDYPSWNFRWRLRTSFAFRSGAILRATHCTVAPRDGRFLLPGLVVRHIPANGMPLLRGRHGVPELRWQTWTRSPRDAEQWRRRDEIWRLAFTALGGPTAARAFLDKFVPSKGQSLFDAAMASSMGQLQVSHLIRKTATRPSFLRD